MKHFNKCDVGGMLPSKDGFSPSESAPERTREVTEEE